MADTPPTLVTGEQLASELQQVVTPARPARRHRWLFWLIGLLIVSALVVATYYFLWSGSTADADSIASSGTTLDDSPSLDNAPPLESTETQSTAKSTDSTADDTTAAGRDAIRRQRISDLLEAAETAGDSVNLPITTAVVRLDDSTNTTIIALTDILLDHGATEEQIAEYLTDPRPEKYYFGYLFDGTTLTLTAVMENGGIDCTDVQTASGSLCILSSSIRL